MQYNLKKILEDKARIKLTWHGADTMVKLTTDNTPKVAVATGETVDVGVDVARFLLKYSDLWTLEGDKPVEQGWRKARAEALDSSAPKENKVKDMSEKPEGEVEDLTPEGISKMKSKELKAVLTEMEVPFKSGDSVPTLKELLLEVVDGASEDADLPEDDDEEDVTEDEEGAEDEESDE